MLDKDKDKRLSWEELFCDPKILPALEEPGISLDV